ncbi:MAG: DUF554 domain-containing protein, partial [Lachnospiraceae bacterium]|nr:DUF554 domain-containing protein [Lachnospiraceae bacterium]
MGMPVGILVNVGAVVIGGFLGSLMGEKMSGTLKDTLTKVFGFCALAMGITLVVRMVNMPAVVFAVISGTIIGTALDLDTRIRRGTGKALSALKLNGIDNDLMLTAMVLFCASGTGIYGSLISGMTGDHSILFAKSILDFFTAMVFACQLKKATCLIGVPQIVIMLALFFAARLIFPLTTDVMIDDFRAVGGLILLGT